MLPRLTLHTAAGKTTQLNDLSGNVLLIVNVASRCAYTGQYAALEKLHRLYGQRGLRVLGFPCNDFGGQEPGSLPEILEFCRNNFGATFEIFEKIHVSGPEMHPLYEWLTGEGCPEPGEVRWNFEKFLIDRAGRIVARFRSQVAPDDGDLVADIEKAMRDGELAKR